MSDNTLVDNMVTDTTDDSENQAQAKTYTQEQVDNMMARMRGSLQKKLLKPYEDLGDPEELRQLRAEAEQRRQEQQLKRGEFEKTLQELASKKDAEIQKRDMIIQDYKLNMPLVNAAAQFKAVNPEQVKTLLRNSVRLNENGDAEVLDTQGNVRYTDSGEPLSVTAFVEEWLNQNPHFIGAGPSTVNTKSQVTAAPAQRISLADLDLTRAKDREIYREAKAKGLL